ncbi:MAG: alpha-glucosidase [Lachnospiraceae bacterium]|nr:alpha-glucosidase [Candidatus Colinaster equi]
MISKESTVRELYDTPVGNDIINKLLLSMGLSRKLVNNGIVGRIKLSKLANLTKKKLGLGFWDSFIDLVNTCTDIPGPKEGLVSEQWWKEAVFYQIYPRTFCDSNGDGIGDLQGIISKLDYLKGLGVDALWLSPIYDSPNDDNGYDIRDYRKIMTEFGDMADFDELLEEVHKRGMRIILDLVVNHTSDEHEWFKNALKEPKNKYRDYYIFRDKPNNWTSFFAGSAWNEYPDINKYGLHLFSKKQMDLNWDNEEVRADVIDMVNWWLDKGIDGFRMDVINLISKKEGLPDGDLLIGDMMAVTGIEHYFYGPNLHKYIKEIKEKAFAPHNAFSVGETPGLGMQMARLLTGEERGELDMIFSFDHLDAPGHSRFDDYKYDLNYYRDYILDWTTNYGNNCWMSLFYNNHDNPKMVSKVAGNDGHEQEIIRLLAVMQMTLKGTPFVYQGEEMGICNYDFKSMDDLEDVESKGFYKRFIDEGKTKEEAFRLILSGTRDHARVPIPWEENMTSGNRFVNTQKADESVTNVYRSLIALRKEHRELIYGDLKVLDKSKDRFVYSRGDKFIIDCNLGNTKKKAYHVPEGYCTVFPESKMPSLSELGPYETRIYIAK